MNQLLASLAFFFHDAVVQVALVLNKSGEDDPFNAWSLATGEALSPDSGAVVWYLATGKQQSDTFFAHGGFFSPLNTPQHVDLTAALSQPASLQVGVQARYAVTINSISGTTQGNIYIQLPGSLRFDSFLADSRTVCHYIEFRNYIECGRPLNTTAGTSATIAVEVTPISNLPAVVSATVDSLDVDTNYVNNKATNTTPVSP